MKKLKKREIYLDNAAATPLDFQIKKIMLPYLAEEYGNPSSVHKKGIKAKKAVAEARQKTARILRCRPEEIIFTAGGTESVNLAILGAAREHAGWENGCLGHIIISSIEHPAVSQAADFLEKGGFAITRVEADKYGFIDPQKIKKALRENTILVSVIYANNEFGTIQPIAEIGKMVEKAKRENGLPYFHTDACQAAGALDLHTDRLRADMISLNGGKIYGPKGSGCLYKKKGVKIRPLVFGGGQENGWRAGTENTAGIAGFAAALELAEKLKTKENKRLVELRDYFIKKLLDEIPLAILNGHPRNRLPNNINISIPGLHGETAVVYLSEKGIYCSTGSACSSSDPEPSAALRALGKTLRKAKSSLRFSLGRKTTKADLDYVLRILPEVMEKIIPPSRYRSERIKNY